MQSIIKERLFVKSNHEQLIDYIKVLACILVVLGHFFQSMVKASILPDNSLYQWFNTTIYYFHVPLFFICSGYLYQKYSCIDSIGAWKNNVIKKAISLGVPYFVFSFATWLLKTIFSGSVNGQVGGLGDTLFIHPTAPYWFLYILFIIFLITPTVKKFKGMGTILVLALVGKVLNIILGGYCVLSIYAVSQFLASWIWFVLGMALAFGTLQKYFSRIWGAVFGVAFLVVSLWSYRFDNSWLSFAMGLIACIAVFMMIAECKDLKVLSWFAKYTMPIFLMHTLFAAPCRALLLKFGITNVAMHVCLGILISFVGPIGAIKIMEKLKPMDFMVFPNRYIHLK